MRVLNLIRRWAHLLWVFSPIVTIPLTVTGVVWSYGTLSDYYHYALRFNTAEFENQSLHTAGKLMAHRMYKGAFGSIIPSTYREGDVKEVRIYVDEAKLKALDSDLPYSGREYVKARLLYPDGDIHSIDFRYRGDYPYHWYGGKKSLRVKTKKKHLYEGMRVFNLIASKNPLMVSNHLSYKLARRLGIMAPESEMVEVYINGKYVGLQLMVENLNEQFLRRNGRMPGDIFVGELVGRDAVPDRGLGGEVFFNADFWQKASYNNHREEGWREALVDLTKSLYTDDFDRFFSLLDMDAWGRFGAFILISRSTHFDMYHNWRLFFNPSTGKFEPIVWDSVGMGYLRNDFVIDEGEFEIIRTTLFEKLLQSNLFIEKRFDAVVDFLTKGGADDIGAALEETERLVPSIMRDPNLVFRAHYTEDNESVVATLDNAKRHYGDFIKEFKRFFIETPPRAYYSVDGSGDIQINVESFQPVSSIALDLGGRGDGATTEGIEEVSILYKRRGRHIEVPVRFSGGVASTTRVDTRLHAKRSKEYENASPASYLLRLKGRGGAPVGSYVRDLYFGYGEGKMVRGRRVSSMEFYPLDNTSHVITERGKAESGEGGLVWSGVKRVDGVLEVNEDLTIRRGTVVSLGPGATIVIGGRLTVEGTEDEPVRFVRGEEGSPWGAVALQGGLGELLSPDGSVIRNAIFSGGSGAIHNFIEYSGMFSFHSVNDLLVEKTLFKNNSLVDDMVHGLHSKAIFKGVTIEGAKFDGLDLDYVDGVIEGSTFRDNGNDGLDLMSSKVAVLSSIMKGSGDKGASVGEGSEAYFEGSLIEENNIGIQVKDSSRAFVLGTDFLGNRDGIDAYSKNWQYGDGGHVRVYGGTVSSVARWGEDEGVLLGAAKGSTIKVFGSDLSGEFKEGKRVEVKGKDPASPQGLDDYRESVKPLLSEVLRSFIDK